MSKNKAYTSRSREIILYINPKIYSQEAIYATCYVFLDRFYVFLDEVKKLIKVSLRPKTTLRAKQEEIRGAFMNELLNNALRYKISKRNQKIREMIVKEALFFSQPKEEIDRLMLGRRTAKHK